MSLRPYDIDINKDESTNGLCIIFLNTVIMFVLVFPDSNPDTLSQHKVGLPKIMLDQT